MAQLLICLVILSLVIALPCLVEVLQNVTRTKQIKAKLEQIRAALEQPVSYERQDKEGLSV